MTCQLAPRTFTYEYTQDVEQLLGRTGGHLRGLEATAYYLPYLSLIPDMHKLKLMLDAKAFKSEHKVCKTSLQHLTLLQELVLECDCTDTNAGGWIVDGLQQLPNLRCLSVDDVGVPSLPPHLTKLRLSANNVELPWAIFQRMAGLKLKEYTGKLCKADITMNLFESDTAQLRSAPCLREVSEVILAWDFLCDQHITRWPCGFFANLQVLRLHIIDVNQMEDDPFTPHWDLSSCTSLQSCSFYFGTMAVVCLDHITNLRCAAVDFDCSIATFGLGLSCTTWMVNKVSVAFNSFKPLGERISSYPAIVQEVVGAVLRIPSLSELWLEDKDWSHMLCAQGSDAH